MKYKVVILVTLFSLLFPIFSFAEEGEKEMESIIHDYPENVTISGNAQSYGNVVDKNLKTRAILNLDQQNQKYIRFTFNNPVDIKKTFAKWANVDTEFVYIVTFNNGSEREFSLKEIFNNEGYKKTNFKNVKSFEIRANPHNGKYLHLYEVDLFGKVYPSIPGSENDETPPEEVTNIKFKPSHDSVKITYKKPDDVDYSHANIYIDGKKYKGGNGSAVIDGLALDTSYSATIKTVDTRGNESKGITKKFKTNPLLPPENPSDLLEVKNLKIKNMDDRRVDIAWENPSYFFEKAKIYRKELGGDKTALNLNPFAPMKVHASGYKPLFETNGTEFSDLSIEPKKEYEYKVTTNYNGMESDGVIVRADVPKAPIADTRDAKLPFGVEELIKSGNGLIALVGGFILLALAFVFVPKVIKLIKDSNSNQKGETKATEGKKGRDLRTGRVSAKLPREPRTGRMVTRVPRETTKLARESTRTPREPRIGRR